MISITRCGRRHVFVAMGECGGCGPVASNHLGSKVAGGGFSSISSYASRSAPTIGGCRRSRRWARRGLGVRRAGRIVPTGDSDAVIMASRLRVPTPDSWRRTATRLDGARDPREGFLCRRRGFRWHREMRKFFQDYFTGNLSVARLFGDLGRLTGKRRFQTPARKTVMPVSLLHRPISRFRQEVLYRASLSRPSPLMQLTSPTFLLLGGDGCRHRACSWPDESTPRAICESRLSRRAGSFATGVTALTALVPDGELIGLTISLFNSVSIESR